LFLPFGIGALLGRAGLAAILHVTAAVCAAVGVIAAGLRFPPPKQRQSLPVREVPRFLRMPLVLAMAFLLFFESGNEFILGGYLSTFLTRELAASVAAASWLLALFWASIMAARVVLSRLLLEAGGHQVVLCSAAAAAVGAALIALSRTLGVAAAGIALAGFSLAGIFPTVLGMAGARFREHSGTVFGILFTVALTGGMTLPWLSGQLAQAAGLRWVPALVAVDFLAIILLQCAAARRTAD